MLRLDPFALVLREEGGAEEYRNPREAEPEVRERVLHVAQREPALVERRPRYSAEQAEGYYRDDRQPEEERPVYHRVRNVRRGIEHHVVDKREGHAGDHDYDAEARLRGREQIEEEVEILETARRKEALERGASLGSS